MKKVEDKVRELIQNLLNDKPVNGIQPGDCGPWAEVALSLMEAHQAGGTEGARKAFAALERTYPGLAQLAASDPPRSDPPKLIWSADEMLKANFPEPRWAIPDLLPVGLSILAGRPKLGKSWLALQIAQAVGAGGIVLGQRVEVGPVAYFALEDSPRRIKDRMEKQGWPSGLPVNFFFKAEEGLREVAKLIENEGPRLVIIDTLSRILPPKTDQNSISEVTSSLDALQKMALQANSALLLVDHHRKMQGEDHIDEILGSTGKSAVADCLWGLFRQRGEQGAILKVTGRDLEEKELGLEWDLRFFCWQLLGDAAEVGNKTIQRKILQAIKDLGKDDKGISVSELASELNQKKENISRGLSLLIKKGLIRRGEKDGKRIPYFPISSQADQAER